MKISTILDQIDLGSIALPEFQRGYVWSRPQVRKFMRSLYHGYPVGSLLIWETETELADARGDGQLSRGTVKLLLDGQQRVTSLYGIIRGKAPQFFEGNEKAFTGIWFNLEEEEFEFYGPVKMKDDPLWISVTELMQVGAGNFVQRIANDTRLAPYLSEYLNRLNRIDNIKNRDFHMEVVTGQDKSTDVVVDIFNEVNSGGTKLSKGDLALAKICAAWPDARNEMNACLDKWGRAGFNFKLDWFLRCINSILTGEALFSYLDSVTTSEFKDGILRAEKHVDTLINLISGRLGLDHDRVLGSRYSFPLMVRYLDERGGFLSDASERDGLLYWYIHTFLWGRYAGSTESYLNKDLSLIEDRDNALDNLIQELRQQRGDLTVQTQDFRAWGKGSRFYPVMYMLTRVWNALDWETGIPLNAHMLGRLSGLQIHHIFPKSLLYDYGYSKSEVNAIANFTFLTQETNLIVSNKDPFEYLRDYAERNPGVILSHWIPMDPELWKIENYLDFLQARQELLAEAANDLLTNLLEDGLEDYEIEDSILDQEVGVMRGSVDSETEEQALLEALVWVEEQGLAEGEYQYELVDETTDESLAVLDLAWPKGLQENYSQPIAILIDEPDDVHELAVHAGYLYFTSIDDFKDYVEREVFGFEKAY